MTPSSNTADEDDELGIIHTHTEHEYLYLTDQPHPIRIHLGARRAKSETLVDVRVEGDCFWMADPASSYSVILAP